MKTDREGVSMCPRGGEQHEEFKSGGKTKVQYDYRRQSGKLFSCVAPTLEAALKKRDAWLLELLRQEITAAALTLTRPQSYGAQIIRYSLVEIKERFGKDEANKAIRDMRLESKGWSQE